MAKSNSFSQGGVQVQTQVQTLTPQQLLVAHLTEMPLQALAERVDIELKENPTLERRTDADSDDYASPDSRDDGKDDYSANDYGPDGDMSILAEGGDERSGDYNSPDDVPDNMPTTTRRGIIDAIDGETRSFYDQLEEQMGFFSLSDHERQILRYIIGSLDDDGLLRVSLTQLQDELEVYHNIATSPQELEHILHILQNFEPAGVGARSLQECLMLQVEHAPDHAAPVKQRLMQLLRECFDLLMLGRWDKIRSRMRLTPTETARLQHEVRRLNPRPGSSMGEALGRNLQQITPDFIVETDPYGGITMQLNQRGLPPLTVSADDEGLLHDLEKQKPAQLTRSEREGLTYMRERVEKARSFIDALEQRRRTLTTTMQAIIRLQRPFFETGDETLLRPMTLDDVAQLTGLHLSTISRVSNSKWVETTFGIFPLKWFFTSAAHKDGDDVSVRHIQATLQELIDAEDKTQPLSDDTLTEMLRQRGYDVARRTVAKYRTLLKIPVARLRKQFT
ncbi:MAG: RNA polymerase factor sigma-54 [Bacteroidaceae bacterium]|nr:RNA polymerase factor sigma-54 [Bacteroidaceae bacterium]